MSHVTIGTAPCSWGVWWADGTPSGTPWEVFLDQAAEGGYKTLELGPDGYLPTDIGQLTEELGRRGLSVCAGTACYNFAELSSFAEVRDKVDALCRRITAFGAAYLVTMDGTNMGYYGEFKKGLTEDDWKKYYAMFREMGEYTRSQHGVEVVFHQHNKTLIETEEELVRIMEDSGLKLCFDTGHFTFAGEDPVAVLGKFADRVGHVHLKNMRMPIVEKVKAEDWSFLKAVREGAFTVPGDPDGCVDFDSVFEILDKAGYEGWIMVEAEQDPAKANPFEYAKTARAYIKEHTGL